MQIETKIKEYLQKRVSYLNELLKFNYTFFVWARGWISWRPIILFNLEDLAKNTALHRQILPNEWVFDIDGKTYGDAYNLALGLENVLKKFEIPFNRWSSGNFLHYHVFMDDSSLHDYEFPLYKKIMKHYFLILRKKIITSVDDIVEFQREIHKSMGLFLLRNIEKVENAWFDEQKFISKRCLIRCEGSQNEKTKAYKTFLYTLPKQQTSVKSCVNVEFPLKIIVWKPDPEFYFKLFTLAYKYIVIPKYRKKPFLKGKNMRKKSGKSNKNPKVNWIETILKNTFTDGRKRMIDLVLVPYLANFKNLNEDKAVEIIHKWALRCHKKEPIKINKRIADPNSLHAYIKYKVTRAKDIGLNFLSRKNAKFVFSDCYDVLKILNQNTQGKIPFDNFSNRNFGKENKMDFEKYGFQNSRNKIE